jgi:hypothetical protein
METWRSAAWSIDSGWMVRLPYRGRTNGVSWPCSRIAPDQSRRNACGEGDHAGKLTPTNCTPRPAGGWPDAAADGWWVGWVEWQKKVYPFALNIDMLKDEDAGKRITIGKECLKALGKL